jgi:cryptochrome
MGSRLIVAQGKPVEVFGQLIQDWSITNLYFEVDTEPYARMRDA